jgi:membrane-bound lytic murein transglycosylase B
MPDCYVKFAVDFDGDGKRDLWNDMGDVFASTANNLAKEGWKGGLPWGVPVVLPTGFDPGQTGRDKRRAGTEWLRMGVRTLNGAEPPHAAEATAIVLPGGAGGEAFMVYSANFRALRAYNPSDYYALSIGLIGDRVVA